MENISTAHDEFIRILANERFPEYINEILKLLSNNEANREKIHDILCQHFSHVTKQMKNELLDVILCYIRLALKDHDLSETVRNEVKDLKMLFNIKEGDYYKYKKHEVAEIINQELESLYLDNKVDDNEEKLLVEIQSVFDLGYDQFVKFGRNAVENALAQGANLSDLDTVYFQSKN